MKIAAFIAAAAATALSACGSFPIQPPIVGYTCCNLRTDGGWVSSNNVQGGAIIPAGEPVVFDSVKKRYYVYGTVGGIGTGLRDDNSKSEAETLRWVRSIVVATSPRDGILRWPEDVRLAVQYGKVKAGMSKAQVLTSLGHPSRSDTPDPESAVWRYWTSKDDLPVDLHFDDNGLMTHVSGQRSAVQTVLSDR